MLVDSKSVKKIDNLIVFFTILESASVKAVCRTLMKSSPVFHQYTVNNIPEKKIVFKFDCYQNYRDFHIKVGIHKTS